jgi:hypothetical protein
LIQATRPLTAADPNDPTAEHRPVAPPIATWFERSGAELRTGWAELRDFLPKRWGLSRLRLRAGGQHVYGPWIVHLDGTVLAYDGELLTASLYGGTRHLDYARDQAEKRPAIFGASARIDLRGLSTSLPIAVQGEFLHHGQSKTPDAPGHQPANQSTLIQADWRPGREIAVILQMRRLNNATATQRIEVRTRFRQVTNFVFDVIRRTQDDWLWDPSVVRAEDDPLAARRYLDLGPVTPQLLGSIRAGTVIAENVDIYARGALSTDLKGQTEQRTAFSAPFAEFGGGFEVRLRRAVALGASILSRTITHDSMDPIVDEATPQRLPPSGAQGEDGFTEIGSTLKISLGARRFSAQVEGYGRRTRFDKLYVTVPSSDPEPIPTRFDEVPTSSVRMGGRFTVDAWVGERVRLFAAYDVSGLLDTAPEISGYKSLRLMMSGVY